MSESIKNILVVARDDKVEALRMATGLTLLDDAVRVAVIGELDENADDVQLQLEALEFADVPIECLDIAADGYKALAGMMSESNAVLVV
jgi:hypothetical protein